jgi:N6-adenosine-specific RNA methylase IME4
MSQKMASETFKVSVDTLQRAKLVNNAGVPALKEAVQAGKLDVTNASAVASLPAEQQTELVAKGPKAILAAAKKINKENKAVIRKKQLDHLIKLRKQNKPLHVDGQTFELICADPAWDYLGTLDTPYPTMPLAEILAMPVTQRAAKDAVLFLWVPASLVAEGLEVIKAWGFNYKTCAVWKKGESGTGGYFRVNHEMLMFATRGDVPTVAEGKRPVSCFEEAKREHSVKPEKAFEMIDAMYPELTKLELFCRGTPRQGWSGWGNECEGAIDADVNFAPTATDATGDQLACTASAQSDGADLASPCGDTVAEVAVAANDEDIGDELIRAITPVTYHPPKRPAKAA